ncbi:MAG TPA: hypothetical protein PKG82_07460 [Myxococcota bacterium]|nr:hypothetical protein [Myxococcota bacterium]
MDRSLPAWGIYRLLKALGDKKATGLLNVQFEAAEPGSSSSRAS